MRVVVFGCGPAGLMAAHAAKSSGAKVDIYSIRRKSELFGCQYLHQPIPGMTDVAPVEVKYQLHGDVEQYKQKVYGDRWEGTVSPEDYLGEHSAWDIRRTYDNLWDEYGRFVYGTSLSKEFMGIFMETDAKRYDLIISSVPRKVFCKDDSHWFRSSSVWALGDAPERGIFVPEHVPNNTVVCNSLPMPTWYRASRVFGYSTVEWPNGMSAPHPAASQVTKPLAHGCDCWPEIMHVGRYGAWQKDLLSHTAYRAVLDTLVTESVG